MSWSEQVHPHTSSYCDIASLMTFAWDTFVAVPADWGQVQA